VQQNKVFKIIPRRSLSIMVQLHRDQLHSGQKSSLWISWSKENQTSASELRDI